MRATDNRKETTACPAQISSNGLQRDKRHNCRAQGGKRHAVRTALEGPLQPRRIGLASVHMLILVERLVQNYRFRLLLLSLHHVGVGHCPAVTYRRGGPSQGQSQPSCRLLGFLGARLSWQPAVKIDSRGRKPPVNCQPSKHCQRPSFSCQATSFQQSSLICSAVQYLRTRKNVARGRIRTWAPVGRYPACDAPLHYQGYGTAVPSKQVQLFSCATPPDQE